jgi:hypothetical protein
MVGQPFGEKYLYKWWKRTCANLGIEDVDLYSGTRHSSATALNQSSVNAHMPFSLPDTALMPLTLFLKFKLS